MRRQPARRLGLLALLGITSCLGTGEPPLSPIPLATVTLAVAAGPIHHRHIELGLAQGGESPDPAFLQPTAPLVRPLGIRYVRVDGIYNAPGLVQARSGGGLTYDWTALDTLIDSIRALGAEPLLDLSYMPPALNAESQLLPPTDWTAWDKLVRATVRHVNTDRRLGLRYWEIWNEPNLWGAWHGSYPQYLNLYNISRRAIQERDPTARVGGPSLSLYEESALDWLLGAQSAQADGGAVDFLSWHAYGWTPAEMAAQVQAARALVARKRPVAQPVELWITELGVRTGGPGDTSVDNRADTPAAAAHLLAALTALEAAGLDKLFVFELRDGPHNGATFWGRFGILTYDLHPKPIYHALAALAALGPDWAPVTVQPARLDVGLLAAPSGAAIVWHTGNAPLRVRVQLPAGGPRSVQVTLFDAAHNNPAAGKGGDTPLPLGRRAPADLVFDLLPDSMVVLQP